MYKVRFKMQGNYLHTVNGKIKSRPFVYFELKGIETVFKSPDSVMPKVFNHVLETVGVDDGHNVIGLAKVDEVQLEIVSEIDDF